MVGGGGERVWRVGGTGGANGSRMIMLKMKGVRLSRKGHEKLTDK